MSLCGTNKTKRNLSLAMSSLVLAVQPARTEAGSRLAVSSAGWTVVAEEKSGVLTISRERLGTVLRDVRLYRRGPHRLEPLKGWTVGKLEDNGLSIQTAASPSTWAIKLGLDVLTISTTTAEGVLTAEPQSGGHVLWPGTGLGLQTAQPVRSTDGYIYRFLRANLHDAQPARCESARAYSSRTR